MRRQIIKSWEKRKMKALRPPRCTGVIYLDSFSVIGPESFTQVQKSWVNCKNSASYLPTTLHDIERNTERKSETLKQRQRQRQKQWQGYLVGGIRSEKGPYQIMSHGTVYITWNFNFTIEVSTHILTKTTIFLSTWVFILCKYLYLDVLYFDITCIFCRRREQTYSFHLLDTFPPTQSA